MPSMKLTDWLFESMEKLGQAGVDSPRRDALVLLEDTLEKDRSWVLAHPEYELSQTVLDTLAGLIRRRASREPLAYIRGKAWFYKRFFEVSPVVMIPRPESESFIDLIKQFNPRTVIDIGTGSGCLAIAAKLEMPQSEVTAIDTSSQALKTARRNARNYSVEIKFIAGDLLMPLMALEFRPQATAILANLPYVPDSVMTSPEIAQEPPEALFSGMDGLDHYREFWRQAALLKSKPASILTESLESQHAAIEAFAGAAGYALEKTDVLVQLFKKTA